MGWIVAILIGIAAGWLAEKIMGRNHGLLTNLVVGVIGGLIGGFIATQLNIGVSGLLGTLIFATLGAVILLFIVGLFKRR
ncbi:MAG: GlsB/YeaQ/YmgE family stress response membrane protein [Caulobacter sp.]|nr:GlsB/YeaQ/YmgE family stress response membrane protein [Caulobacter sp.]